MDRVSYEKAMTIISAMERCVAIAIAQLDAIEAADMHSMQKLAA